MSEEKTLKQTLDYLVKSKIANKDTMIFLNYVGKEVDKEKDLMFGTVEDIRINYKEKLTDYVEEISFNTINIVNGNIGSIKVTLRENGLSSLLYDLKSIYDNFINEETKIKSFKIPQISNVSDSGLSYYEKSFIIVPKKAIDHVVSLYNTLVNNDIVIDGVSLSVDFDQKED